MDADWDASEWAELTELPEELEELAKRWDPPAATLVAAVAKLPAEGVRDGAGVIAGGVAPGVVAGTVLTTGRTGPVWGMRILVLTGPPGFIEISRASDLPPVGVL